MFRFELEVDKAAARPAFAGSWQRARKLIDAGKLDDAEHAVESLDPFTSYEGSQADLLSAEIYRLQGDAGRELRSLESATTLPEDMTPTQRASVLRRMFVLQLKTQRFGEALETHQTLVAMGASQDDQRSVAEKLQALVDGQQPITSPLDATK